MPALRIAKITYDHHPIEFSKDGTSSIGEIIDRHLAETVKQGNLVNEVSLYFETLAEQQQVSMYYEGKYQSNDYAVAVDDGYSSKPKKRY